MDIASLQEKLAKLTPNKGSNKKIYLKLTEKFQTIRILPYPHAKDPFIEIYWHYNIAGVNSIYCPKENEGLPCPICDLAEKFRTAGGKDNFNLFSLCSTVRSAISIRPLPSMSAVGS